MIGLVTNVFKVLIGAYTKRADQATQLRVAEMDVDKVEMRQRASIIRTAMSVKVFWVVWAMFAFPLGGWWCLVMLDTATPAHVLNMGIPMLPDTIRPYADQIFNSIFFSGAGVAGTQSIVRGVLNVMAAPNRKG